MPLIPAPAQREQLPPEGLLLVSVSGLTVLCLSHHDVPVPNLDGSGVLDGNVAVGAGLTDHVDRILLVNDCSGLISSSRTFCKIIFHSLYLCRGQRFRMAAGSISGASLLTLPVSCAPP